MAHESGKAAEKALTNSIQHPIANCELRLYGLSFFLSFSQTPSLPLFIPHPPRMIHYVEYREPFPCMRGGLRWKETQLWGTFWPEKLNSEFASYSAVPYKNSPLSTSPHHTLLDSPPEKIQRIKSD
jgi:hypothetical protein